MKAKLKVLLPIFIVSVIPTLLVWLPFYLKLKSFWSIPLPQNGMGTIVANYDGPLYLVVAKTLYNGLLIKENYSFGLPVEYYAAHFPLFPVLIKVFSFALGFPYAMLFVTALSSFLAIYYFYKLAKLYFKDQDALFVTLAFAIFPARWLIVRSVGSADPLFLFGIIASIYYFIQKKYLWAGIFGAVAQFTKSPGILLFLAYFGATFSPRIKEIATTRFSKWFRSLEIEKVYPILLIPLSLVGVFYIFKITYGNFWAYFSSGDNIHLSYLPFQIFNYSAPWVGTFWLEEIIFVYLIGIFGLIRLIKQKVGVITWFVGIFFASTLFVSHRDLIRYSLPIVPFLYIAFSDLVVKREFKLALVFIAFPIYLYSLAYISQNVMPISNWAPFL